MTKERNRIPFVVAEGGSGVGKTTAIKNIWGKLEGWYAFREPGGTEFGNAVREAVQGHKEWEIDPLASLFAYQASRANMINTVILPLLGERSEARGVLLDRYWFSTYAYQGAEGVDKEIIIAVSKMATKGLMPDLVLHFDLLPELALKRKESCSDIDRFDQMKLDYHRRVRDSYMELARMYPEFWVTIDASKSQDGVAEDVLNVMRERKII